jgi:opacity protein-like surface antigen
LFQYRSEIVVVTLAAILWTSTASAQGMENTRSVTFSIGTGLALGGNVITEAVGSIDGRPSVFVEQGYGNHFSDALRLRVTGNQGLNFRNEVFATFAYNKMNATERITGSVGGYPLYTRFSNTSALDLEGGLRYYFLPEGPTRTYVAGVGGVRFQDRIGATIRVLEVGLTLEDFDYFESSTLFIFGGDAGVSRDLSDTIAIGAEIGLRYQPKFSPSPVLAGTGLETINDTGSRVALPMSAFLTWRF